MCVQIGNRIFLSCVLRIPDWVRADETAPIQLPSSPEKSLFQMGIRAEACLGRLDGLTGRSARRRDLVRLGKKVLGGSGETGGWAKAAGVGAAGGAPAQRVAKRGMNSCDALLCDPVGILSGHAEGIKVAQSGANCRVNSCAALLFLQKFLQIGTARCAGWGGVMVLQPCMFCKKYTFVKGLIYQSNMLSRFGLDKCAKVRYNSNIIGCYSGEENGAQGTRKAF